MTLVAGSAAVLVPTFGLSGMATSAAAAVAVFAVASAGWVWLATAAGRTTERRAATSVGRA